ncbi:hypothetical protein EDD85DRAFT_795035 [Armillaria nabsnona]|nr:hypothetical protein EDD85DRAFT_795035 [Armillaria nabsnona]
MALRFGWLAEGLDGVCRLLKRSAGQTLWQRTVNPFRYCSVAALIEVYNVGQVWVNILHNVYATLVSELGWSDTAKTDRTDGHEQIRCRQYSHLVEGLLVVARRLSFRFMDANGHLVAINILRQKENPFQLVLGTLLTSEEKSPDHRNHRALILRTLPIPDQDRHVIVVIGILPSCKP